MRLRKDDYPDALITSWADRIRAQPWKEAFVFVKHDEGNAPAVAARLAGALAGSPSRATRA